MALGRPRVWRPLSPLEAATRPSFLFLSFAVLLSFLLFSPPCVESTRDTWTDDTSDILYFVDRFAFKEDGEWIVQIDPRQKGVALDLLICRDGNYKDTVDGYSTSDGQDVCNKISNNGTGCIVEPFKGFANISGTAHSRDMYWFVLVNCNQSKLNLGFYEYFINPHDEYLGWDNIPLPYIYGILIIIYAALLVAWLLNIVMIDMGAGSNRLHKYLSMWPIMKLFLVVFNTSYWAYISQEGVVSLGVVVIYIIYNSLWYSYLFGGLILIGMAWGISRASLTWLEVIIIAVVEFVFYITWVINLALEGYFALVSVVGLGCMLVVIYLFTSYSLRKVETALKKSQPTTPAETTPSSESITEEAPAPRAELSDLRYRRSKLTLQERRHILGYFLLIQLFYIIPMILVQSEFIQTAKPFFILYFKLQWALIYACLFHYENWAYFMLTEGTELCLVLALGWLFRLRRRNIYFEFNDDALADWEKRKDTTQSEDGHIEMDSIPHHHSEETFHNPDVATAEPHFAPEDDAMPPVYPLPSERTETTA